MRNRLVLFASLAAALSACSRSPETRPPTTQAGTSAGEVVVYVALDRQFSEPILNDFAALTGIRVRPAYDTESTKSVGLANRIRAESARPRCDVFWNNEILNTIRLKQDGLLQPCRPSQAENYPAQYLDPEGCWYGFAARARVLIANSELVPPAARPRCVADLADPRWKGRVGVAKPLFGTTATHVACLFATMGEEPAKALLGSLKANGIQVLGGNKGCAEAVGAGRLALALTDTDDAMIELDAGRPVNMLLADAGAADSGVLLLPNTLALVKDCPNAEGGLRLIDYLLSPEVEARLAAGTSAQIPLNRHVRQRSRVATATGAADLNSIRYMEVDFSQAAAAFPAAAAFVEREFLAP
ncbi:MAG: extracellular solute-binding protein [Planctomycetota bacterium]